MSQSQRRQCKTILLLLIMAALSLTACSPAAASTDTPVYLFRMLLKFRHGSG